MVQDSSIRNYSCSNMKFQILQIQICSFTCSIFLFSRESVVFSSVFCASNFFPPVNFLPTKTISNNNNVRMNVRLFF